MMTLFNAIISKKTNFQTLEPQKVLGKMTNRIAPVDKMTSIVIGWLLHFFVGHILSVLDRTLMRITRVKTGSYGALAYGTLDGLIGVLTWIITFKIHPKPPNINLKEYYFQLFVSHLIYGLFHKWTLRLMKKQSFRNTFKLNS